MFCDAGGRPAYPGNTPRVLEWDVLFDAAKPSWLTTLGTSPVETFETVASGRGRYRIQTKATTPAVDDIAGVQIGPAGIATANFEEIGFCVYSLKTDGASALDHVLTMAMNASGTQGFFIQNAITINGDFQYRLYPSASATTAYPWAKDGNPLRQRNLCVIIRPRSKEFWVFLGNPYEGGASEIYYNKGNWTDVSGSSFKLSIQTKEAAQHWMEFSKLKMWFVSL